MIVPSPAALYPTAVLWGLLGAAGNILVISTRQRLIPAALLGRVNSAYRLLGMGGMPVGAMLGGVVAEAAGICDRPGGGHGAVPGSDPRGVARPV